MKPVVINGKAWRVVRVSPDDPRLIDRLGLKTLGTTDPRTMTIHISNAIEPPLLDRVLLHEIAHAVTISYGLVDALHEHIPSKYWVWLEEWACHIVETYSLEASRLATKVLSRPVCVRGFCND